MTVTVIEFSADLLDKCALLDTCVGQVLYYEQVCDVVGLSDSASGVTAYM